jgi:SAM-dependent methyltransferase
LSGFDSAWLDLREPADQRARADALLDALARFRAAPSLEIVDLGAGTGANLRHLSPLLGGAQHWTLIDDDPAVLAAGRTRIRSWACERGAACSDNGGTLTIDAQGSSYRIEFTQQDLAAQIDSLPIPRGGLVTASALLDLVSAAWLDALAARCRQQRAAVLFALSYDGRMRFEPELPDDAWLTELVNRHQRRDKGFGAALGPTAAAHAEQSFTRLGYRLSSAASDWQLDGSSAALQAALIDGWLAAAIETAPDRRARLEDWADQRRKAIASRKSTITVGHVDVVGELPADD